MAWADLVPVANHLWQSTVFVGVVWLLSLMLRSNRAAVRYRLWLAASWKFLVPLSVLVAVGRQVEWRSAGPIAEPSVTLLIETIGQPFVVSGTATIATPSGLSLSDVVPVAILIVWLAGSAMHLLAWAVRWRRVARIVRQAVPLEPGRESTLLHRVQAMAGRSQTIPVVTSDALLEPGVFGVFRPVLFWPRGIGSRLSDQQVDALLIHELSHVRRHDNLAAAIHMLVEAAFWFHPIVWWIENRLVDERERACDEEVLRLGGDPQLYAESILKTCEFYAESPLVCVSGVTGSDLKRRIVAIMQDARRDTLVGWKRALVLIVGVLTFLTPVAIGVLNAPVRAQSAMAERPTFDVVSIKPNKSGDDRVISSTVPNRYTSINMTPQMLILLAYQLQTSQLGGGPAWMTSYRFDIEAKSEHAFSPQELFPMLQSVLADDFGLTFHHETRPIPAYALALTNTKGNAGRLKPGSTATCASVQQPRRGPQSPDAPLACGAVQTFPGHYTGRSVPLIRLVNYLAGRVGRVVVDQTGLDGVWDVELDYTPDRIPPGALGNGADVALNAPSLFTALQEQLGLKLESTRSPVDVMVIDSMHRPPGDAAALVGGPVLRTATQSSTQQPPTQGGGPAFEAASIKPNKARDVLLDKGIRSEPGQFRVTNLTLRELIGTAHEIPPPLRKARMSGGPDWIDKDRFDVIAKVEGNPTLTQRLAMLRNLLIDRFKLVAKTTTRELPIYALTIARSDRKLGPQLRKVADVDCAALRAASKGVPPPVPDPLAPPPCIMRADPGVIVAGAVTISDLIRVAFPRVVRDRVVIDKTGLVGSYSVKVEWTPEAEAFASTADLPTVLPTPPPPSITGPSLFTALQEQLGLKLESTRGPVEVLVIDRVEQPTPD